MISADAVVKPVKTLSCWTTRLRLSHPVVPAVLAGAGFDPSPRPQLWLLLPTPPQEGMQQRAKPRWGAGPESRNNWRKSPQGARCSPGRICLLPAPCPCWLRGAWWWCWDGVGHPEPWHGGARRRRQSSVSLPGDLSDLFALPALGCLFCLRYHLQGSNWLLPPSSLCTWGAQLAGAVSGSPHCSSSPLPRLFLLNGTHWTLVHYHPFSKNSLHPLFSHPPVPHPI